MDFIEWIHAYGQRLCPPPGYSDTFGEGMRRAKDAVATLLPQVGAEQPERRAGVSDLERAAAGSMDHARALLGDNSQSIQVADQWELVAYELERLADKIARGCHINE